MSGKTKPHTPAEQLALWSDQLRDLSALGLRFSDNIYDLEHYQTVQNIAMAMLALATDTSLTALEPLRAPLFARPTPLVVGDGAVIDAEGQLLLIQRADNGLWALPGGALEVGETPAQGVVREVLEETGIHSQAVALAGVFDSRLCGSTSAHHLYHFLFLCQVDARFPPESPSHAVETLASGWFPETALPADLAPGHARRIAEAYRVWHGDAHPFYDPPGHSP